MTTHISRRAISHRDIPITRSRTLYILVTDAFTYARGRSYTYPSANTNYKLRIINAIIRSEVLFIEYLSSSFAATGSRFRQQINGPARARPNCRKFGGQVDGHLLFGRTTQTRSANARVQFWRDGRCHAGPLFVYYRNARTERIIILKTVRKCA